MSSGSKRSNRSDTPLRAFARLDGRSVAGLQPSGTFVCPSGTSECDIAPEHRTGPGGRIRAVGPLGSTFICPAASPRRCPPCRQARLDRVHRATHVMPRAQTACLASELPARVGAQRDVPMVKRPWNCMIDPPMKAAMTRKGGQNRRAGAGEAMMSAPPLALRSASRHPRSRGPEEEVQRCQQH